MRGKNKMIVAMVIIGGMLFVFGSLQLYSQVISDTPSMLKIIFSSISILAGVVILYFQVHKIHGWAKEIKEEHDIINQANAYSGSATSGADSLVVPGKEKLGGATN